MCSAAIVLAPINPQRSFAINFPQQVRFRGAAGFANRQGRWTEDGFGLEFAARKMSHQELGGAGAEIAAVDDHAGQGGKRVLGFLDVVEADNREVRADRNAGFRKPANKSDRDDVVETKGGGRRLGEVEQLRSRRSAARVVGRGFDDQRHVERNSSLFQGNPIAGQALVADQQRRHSTDEGNALVSIRDQMNCRLARAFLVLRSDQRRPQARQPTHHLDDRQTGKQRLQLTG